MAALYNPKAEMKISADVCYMVWKLNKSWQPVVHASRASDTESCYTQIEKEALST